MNVAVLTTFHILPFTPQVESHRLSALPPLRITTSASARQSLQTDRHQASSSSTGRYSLQVGQSSQRAIPNRSKTKDESALGARPRFDMEKAKDLLTYKEGQYLEVMLQTWA